jgi:hypothetical protein
MPNKQLSRKEALELIDRVRRGEVAKNDLLAQEHPAEYWIGRCLDREDPRTYIRLGRVIPASSSHLRKPWVNLIKIRYDDAALIRPLVRPDETAAPHLGWKDRDGEFVAEENTALNRPKGPFKWKAEYPKENDYVSPFL